MAQKCTFNLMPNNLFRFVAELHCVCVMACATGISAPIRSETIKTSLFNASCAFAQNGFLSRHTSTAYIVRSALELLQSRAELRDTNGGLFFFLFLLRIGQIELFYIATIAIILPSIYHSVIFTLNRPGSWIKFHSIKVKMKMNE